MPGEVQSDIEKILSWKMLSQAAQGSVLETWGCGTWGHKRWSLGSTGGWLDSRSSERFPQVTPGWIQPRRQHGMLTYMCLGKTDDGNLLFIATKLKDFLTTGCKNPLNEAPELSRALGRARAPGPPSPLEVLFLS